MFFVYGPPSFVLTVTLIYLAIHLYENGSTTEKAALGIIFVVILLALSGCFLFFFLNETTAKEHPVVDISEDVNSYFYRKQPVKEPYVQNVVSEPIQQSRTTYEPSTNVSYVVQESKQNFATNITPSIDEMRKLFRDSFVPPVSGKKCKILLTNGVSVLGILERSNDEKIVINVSDNTWLTLYRDDIAESQRRFIFADDYADYKLKQKIP